MVNVTVATWMGNAAAVLSGTWGAVTRRAHHSGSRRTAVSTHAQRDDALVLLVARNPLLPEFLQDIGVFRIIPWAFSVPLPLLLRAQHRLMMRGAHDDAVFVGELREATRRVISMCGLAPA